MPLARTPTPREREPPNRPVGCFQGLPFLDLVRGYQQDRPRRRFQIRFAGHVTVRRMRVPSRGQRLAGER